MPSPSQAADAAPASITRVAALLGLLVALTVIGSSAVAVALPVLSADLGLDTSGAAWVLALFSLSFSITTAIFGRLADLVGLRAPLRAGVLLFAAGSVVAATAGSFAQVVAGRLLQGAGAGAVPVLALGVLTARFEGAQRSRALAGLTGVVSLVSGSGPLIGGALTAAVSWRAVLALPVLALLLAEPVARLAPSRPPRRSDDGFDAVGAAATTIVIVSLILLLQSPSTGLAGAPLAAMVSAGVIAAVLLAAHVRHRPDGFLPRSFVTNRAIMLSAAAAAGSLAAYLGMLFTVPGALSERGWPILDIGLVLVPAAAFGSVVSRRVGRLPDSVSRPRAAAAIIATSAVGVAFAAVAPWPAALILAMFPVVGAFAGAQVALLDTATAQMPEERRGVGIAVFNLVFFLGGAVGAALVGGLADRVGLRGALGALSVLTLMGAASALLAVRRRLGEPAGVRG